jgi:hypothetical protein
MGVLSLNLFIYVKLELLEMALYIYKVPVIKYVYWGGVV